MDAPLKVLIVEDEPGHAVAIERAFAHARPQDTVRKVGSLHECRSAIAAEAPDVVITDIQLPDGKAFELLNVPGIVEKFPVIVMTSYGNETIAVEAIKSGAIEYVVKSPEAFNEMPRTVERVMREWAHMQEVKKTREALALSQAELSAVFDGTPVMLCVIDNDRCVLNANRAFHDFVSRVSPCVPQQRPCGILGCIRALDDPAGCGFGPRCGQCGLRIAMADTLRSATAHIDVECEIPIRRNGVEHTVVLLGSITPLPQAGDTARALVSLLDITDRRQAEDALRMSELRFQGVLQNAASVAVQGYSLDGTVRYWNKASEHFYGYTAEEALGRNLLDLIIPPDMREEVISSVSTMVETGVVIPPSELLLMRKDRSLIPVYSSHASVNVPGMDTELFCIDIDITERRQAEDALRSSEEKVTSILNAIDDGVLSYALPGNRILYCSPSCGKIFGQDVLAEIQVDAKAWVARVHPDDLMKLYEWGDQLDMTGFYSKEIRIVRTDGSVIWVYSRHKLIYDNNNIPMRYDITLTDITARRQAEDALRLSEEKVSSILNAIDDAIISFSITDACISYISPSCLHVFGRDITAEISIDPRDWVCLVHPDDLASLYDSVENLHEQGAVEAECRLVRPDGSIIWVLARQKIVYDPETGNSKRFDLMLTDITERKCSEQKLRESEGLLARSQQVAHIGSWQLDVAAQQMVWSDELYRVLGLSPDEHVATYETFFEIVHPDDMPPAQAAFSDFFRGNNDSLEYVHRIIRKDTSEVRYVYERCVHERDANGTIVRSIGMIQDITERKRAEEKAAEHLRELEQWYRVTLNREDRVLELKTEINKLLERLGEQQKYGKNE